MTEDREEFILTMDEEFVKLQAEGKCGEIQDNGRYCKSPVLEWIDLDPDRPFLWVDNRNMGGPRVGACGTHIKQVHPRVLELRRKVNQKRIRNYMDSQFDDMLRAFHAVGFKAIKRSIDGHNVVLLRNPAEFVNTLDSIGALEGLGLKLSEIKRCPSTWTAPPRWNGHQPDTFECEEFEGHEGKHTDWAGTTWEDPKPEPVPEPVSLPVASSGEGGHFQ